MSLITDTSPQNKILQALLGLEPISWGLWKNSAVGNASRAGNERHFPVCTPQPCPSAQYHSCFQPRCVFLPACSNRAAATPQTAVASSFRPLQRECVHSHISGMLGCAPAFCPAFWLPQPPPSAQGKAEAAQSWSGVRRNARAPSPPPLLAVFLCSHNLSASGRREQHPWALPWTLWVPHPGWVSPSFRRAWPQPRARGI